jgi:hypothetical protein
MDMDLCDGAAENCPMAPLDKAAGDFYLVGAHLAHFPCAHDFGEGEADDDGDGAYDEAFAGWDAMDKAIGDKNCQYDNSGVCPPEDLSAVFEDEFHLFLGVTVSI